MTQGKLVSLVELRIGQEIQDLQLSDLVGNGLARVECEENRFFHARFPVHRNRARQVIRRLLDCEVTHRKADVNFDAQRP